MTAPTQSEGDTNLTGRRAEWQARSLDKNARALLARDEAAFLHAKRPWNDKGCGSDRLA